MMSIPNGDSNDDTNAESVNNEHDSEEPRGGRRIAAVTALCVVAGLGVWGFLLGQTLFEVRDDAQRVQAAIGEVQDAARARDTEAAIGLLDETTTRLERISTNLSSSVVEPLRIVPYARRNIDAVIALATAGSSVGNAALDLTDSVESLSNVETAADAPRGANFEAGLQAFAPQGGRMPVESLVHLQPEVTDLRLAVDRVIPRIEAIPTTGVVEQVTRGRAQALEAFTDIAPLLGQADDSLQQLPAILGADGPRNYMVVASNPTESRAGGGFIGAYTMVTIENGELRFERVVPIHDLETIAPGTIPWPDDSLATRYGRFGGTGFALNLNLTPDFPMAATMMENFFEESAGTSVDGLIAVDPFAFAALLKISGPVELPRVGRIGPDEVVNFVSHEAYKSLENPVERKALIGFVATAAFEGVLQRSGDIAPEVLVRELVNLLRSPHMMVHLRNPEEQALLEQFTLDGSLGVVPVDGSTETAQGTDLLAVFSNSATPTKVEFWMQRTLTYDVELRADGSSSSSLTVKSDNQAPSSGEPAYMIGAEGYDVGVGAALSLVSTYCDNCTFTDLPERTYQDGDVLVESELGFDVSTAWVHVPSGETTNHTWRMEKGKAWREEDGTFVYTLIYDHQVMIKPTVLDITLTIPDGFELENKPPNSLVDGNTVRIVDEVTTDRALTFTLLETR